MSFRQKQKNQKRSKTQINHHQQHQRLVLRVLLLLCVKQKRRSQRMGPVQHSPGCLGADRGCCAGWGAQRTAVRGWESGFPSTWTGCSGSGTGAAGTGRSGGGEGAEGARVEGAAVAPAQPGARAGSGHTPAGETCPFAAAAKNCSRWGRWCNGWRTSGSSGGSDPSHIHCRCPVSQ